MRTAVTDLLDIEFPILAFSHCRDVVAAVTNAGGLGVLGAVAGHAHPEVLAAVTDAAARGTSFGAPTGSTAVPATTTSRTTRRTC